MFRSRIQAYLCVFSFSFLAFFFFFYFSSNACKHPFLFFFHFHVILSSLRLCCEPQVTADLGESCSSSPAPFYCWLECDTPLSTYALCHVSCTNTKSSFLQQRRKSVYCTVPSSAPRIKKRKKKVASGAFFFSNSLCVLVYHPQNESAKQHERRWFTLPSSNGFPLDHGRRSSHRGRRRL